MRTAAKMADAHNDSRTAERMRSNRPVILGSTARRRASGNNRKTILDLRHTGCRPRGTLGLLPLGP
jgi:hypothetical protein